MLRNRVFNSWNDTYGNKSLGWYQEHCNLNEYSPSIKNLYGLSARRRKFKIYKIFSTREKFTTHQICYWSWLLCYEWPKNTVKKNAYIRPRFKAGTTFNRTHLLGQIFTTDILIKWSWCLCLDVFQKICDFLCVSLVVFSCSKQQWKIPNSKGRFL